VQGFGLVQNGEGCRPTTGSPEGGVGVLAPLSCDVSPIQAANCWAAPFPNSNKTRTLRACLKGGKRPYPKRRTAKKFPRQPFLPWLLWGAYANTHPPVIGSPVQPLNPVFSCHTSRRFEKIQDPSRRACKNAMRPMDDYAEIQVSCASGSEGPPECRFDFAMSSEMVALP
jgi:hypothetical protein